MRQYTHIYSITQLRIAYYNQQIMRAYQQKLQKYIDTIREYHREETKAELRMWGDLPSVIVELPFRIEHQEWNQFDQLLDSMTPGDLQLISEELRTYIHIQYRKVMGQRKKKDVMNPTIFNLARIVLRLQILDNYQLRDVLGMLRDAIQIYGECKGEGQPLEAIFKILKQLAIYVVQTTETNQQLQTCLISEDNLQQLNRIVSSLTIYKTYQQLSIGQNKQLFNQYRIYYILLLSLKKIDFGGFIKSGNLEQLLYLIDDSLKHKEDGQISLSIKCLSKLLNTKTSQLEQSRVQKTIEVLLIDGLQQAKKYYSSQQTESLNSWDFNFSCQFFEQLLVILNDSYVEVIVNGMQLLGQLFQLSDNYIEAVSRTYNKKSQPYQLQKAEQEKNSNMIYLKARQFPTYKQLFLSFMTHLCIQIRIKNFWIISNILASKKWFYTYGSALLCQIYKQQLLSNQIHNAKVQNQILVCILNYVCSVQYDHRALQKLLQTQFSYSQEIESHVNPSNCFLFCLQTIVETLKLCLSSKTKTSLAISPTKVALFNRAVYALSVMLMVTKQMQRTDLQQIIVYQIDNSELGRQLEEFIMGNTESCSQIKMSVPLVEEILKRVEMSKEKL